VAWIRFLIAAQTTPQTYTDLEVGKLTYEAEVLFFNQPGGLMDQYTIAQGGLLYIDTQTTECTRLKGDLGTLVVAESGLAKQTLSVLKKGRIYGQEAIKAIQKKHPEFQIQNVRPDDYERYKKEVPQDYLPYWYAAVYNYDLTLKAKEALQNKGSYEALGNWMNQHQTILENQIQNTPKPMMHMMNEARKSGALGTKIIGSGGGGCMVAMVSQENKERVVEAFLAAGAKAAYEVAITHHNND
jgi:galactokinase